jgi:hypothetical protein
MPGWVGEDGRPVAARLELWLGCTQLEYPCLGLVEVVDFEVEVELLWHALIWPAGRLVAVGPLGSGQSSVIAVSFIFKGTGSSVREMMSGARSSRPYFRSHRPRGWSHPRENPGAAAPTSRAANG